MARLKIYTDENVDVRVAEGLRIRGVKAFSAIERGLPAFAGREKGDKSSGVSCICGLRDFFFDLPFMHANLATLF